MEYKEFNLQEISDSFFRIGFYSAVMLLQRIYLNSEVEDFDDFMDWINQIENDNNHESEWKDAEVLVNDLAVENE